MLIYAPLLAVPLLLLIYAVTLVQELTILEKCLRFMFTYAMKFVKVLGVLGKSGSAFSHINCYCFFRTT